jgi:hypothetical protein
MTESASFFLIGRPFSAAHILGSEIDEPPSKAQILRDVEATQMLIVSRIVEVVQKNVELDDTKFALAAINLLEEFQST